jgi:hypothetical protein
MYKVNCPTHGYEVYKLKAATLKGAKVEGARLFSGKPDLVIYQHDTPVAKKQSGKWTSAN